MMNAYQRPLFRQAGGPVGLESLPPPPPAGVAAIPQQDPQAMVEAAGQMASSEMESVGQDYVLEMVNSLDSAENFKAVIDTLRGNTLPMDERFAELAEYVGEDDAEKTPESVLAMVQPVIMMTEEGNIDSGIGQLMQGVAGEVDMMTAEGGLTDMGQGVGSLMVANQAPPQRFADGGAVQHFANGSPWGVRGASFLPSNIAGSLQGFTPPTDYDPQALTSAYEQRLPMYMGILDPEKERQMTQSQIMFDIAQAGLNLAGGVDPRPGQSMTQLPVAAQIATAAGGLPQQIGSRIAGQRQSEQAAKLAALQAAESQLTARDAAVAAAQQTVLGESFRMASQELGIAAAFEEQGRGFLNTEQRDYRLEQIEGNLKRLTGDLNIEQIQEQARLFNERDSLQNGYLTQEIANRADAAIGVHAANSEVTFGHNQLLQKQAEDADASWRNLDRDHNKWVAEQQFEDKDQIIALEERRVAHQEAVQEDWKERQLSTDVPFYFGGNLIGGTLGFDSPARNAAEYAQRATERSDALALKGQELMMEAQRLGMTNSGYAQRFQQQMDLLDYDLRNRSQTLNETKFSYGVMVNRMMPAAREEFSRNEMYDLLADPNVIRAYGTGAPMADVELALSQVFKWTRDPETGLMTKTDLPPGWEGAFQQRAGFGLAVPNVGSGSYAEGGAVKKMQGGGDPRGAYEPTTGTYLPRPVSDEPLPIEEPLITATGQGIDITSATGSDAFVVDKLNSAVEAVTGIFGGPGMVLGPEYQEAIRALDSFNQIALTRALGSIAGKENRELQERLARLEVPAARLLYNDRKAYAQFQTSSRVMDFAIREQNAALRGPSLTRSERNKASKDLAALQGIKLEYDRLADAFGRKIEGDTSDVSSRLDQFFN